MFSTELCGKLPDIAAAAAAAILAAAPAPEGDAGAPEKAAGSVSLHLRLADAPVVHSDDELDAEGAGGADEGQLSFVFSSSATMSGLFFQVR